MELRYTEYVCKRRLDGLPTKASLSGEESEACDGSGAYRFAEVDSTFPWTLTVPSLSEGVASSRVKSILNE